MATEVNLEKVMAKLDERKMEELANFLDHVSTLNEVLGKVAQLKDSGALDVLINFSYGAKSLRDALNDDAIQSIADMLSNMMVIAGSMKTRQKEIEDILANADALKDAVMRLKALKDSGTLDVLVNMSYALKSLRDALNDDAITNLGTTLSLIFDFLPKGLEFLNSVVRPPLSELVEALSGEEALKVLSKPENVTLGKLITLMKDPDIQRGLGVMMGMLKVIGKNFRP